MSGNPFRRIQPTEVQASPYSYEPESPPRAVATKKKKKKRVQIQTPPRSPEDPPRRPSLGRISPPPPLPITTRDGEDDDEATHPTEADSKLWEAAMNTRRNSDSRPPLPSAPMGGGAPYNPFARTLATTEALYNIQGQQRDDNKIDVTTKQVGGGRSTLDVDTFKNMLLTGNPGNYQPISQRPPPEAEITGTEIPQRDLSTPSASGHSFDDLESASEEDEDKNEDNENEQVIEPNKMFESVNPLSTAPESDKRLSRGPQTVSFADFNDSFFSDTTPSTAPRSSDSAEGDPKDDSSGKKAPPPPPASRRQGQTGLSSGRARSISNVTDDSIPEAPQPPTKPSDKIIPPPPPPSRKPKPTARSASPAASASVSTASLTSAEPNAIPPPPPSRQQLKAAASLNRTPSIARSSSNSRPETRSAPSPHVPPAPPRRRNAGSERHTPIDEGKQLSTAASEDQDQRRSSSENVPSYHSSETSRAPMSYEAADSISPSDRGSSTDILADMSAFQAEIDALRARGGAGS